MSSSAVILPTTKSIDLKRDLVYPWDSRYERLTGNDFSVTRDTCGKSLWFGCLNHEKHGYPIGKGQKTLSGSQAKPFDVIEHTLMSCGRLGCPVCYEKACAKKAIKIEHIIRQFRWKNRKETKYYHWMLSPSKEDLARYDLKDLRRLAVKLAKLAGIAGGCTIIHHLRKYDEREQNEDLGEGYSWKTAPASWEFSPHIHIIGVGFTSKKKVLHVYEKHGWVVKNLGERKSVRSTAHYQLSHAYVPKKGHTVTWFGLMSYNSKVFKPKPVPKPEPRVCPECECEMVKVQPINSEAEAIVKSKINKEGIYRFEHGLFEPIDSQKPPWSSSGG